MLISTTLCVCQFCQFTVLIKSTFSPLSVDPLGLFEGCDISSYNSVSAYFFLCMFSGSCLFHFEIRWWHRKLDLGQRAGHTTTSTMCPQACPLALVFWGGC